MTKTTNQPKPKVLADLEMRWVGGGVLMDTPGCAVGGDPADLQGPTP